VWVRSKHTRIYWKLKERAPDRTVRKFGTEDAMDLSQVRLLDGDKEILSMDTKLLFTTLKVICLT